MYIRKTKPELLGEAWRSEKITCFCPRCERLHQALIGGNDMAIKWTGRGIPRKFCQTCQQVVKENN